MAITIGGVKVTECSFTKEKDSGELIIKGSYVLESNTGIVLAKSGFNGYSDIKLNESQDTIKLKNEYFRSLGKDLSDTLGLGE